MFGLDRWNGADMAAVEEVVVLGGDDGVFVFSLFRDDVGVALFLGAKDLQTLPR